jgi:ATP-dependent Clp protease adaptor protein ClpS
MKFATKTDYQEDVDVLEEVVPENKLIVHNDEVNTFDWVIETLIDVCNHTCEQAEQCAYIIHAKGKYAVKHGSMQTLLDMKHEITDRGISATIE